MSSIQPPPQPRHPMMACLSLLVLLLASAAIVVAILWYWPGGGGGTGLNPQAQPRAVTPRASLSDEEKSNVEIYQQGSPSLVQVTSMSERSSWFGLDVQEVPKGVGSGFVWDHDGHIVTNYHVVEGAGAVQVTLANHSTYESQQIWAYPDQDIAVIWINAPERELTPIQVGTSHDLKVGQVVYALGDPFGLDGTMTNGIVSALGREMNSANGRVIRGVIQTTAPINPGNSGGPLLDSAGRLIGMNTAIISPSGAFAGIGFAIPVDEINQIAPQLIQHGKVVRPRLGVQLAQDQVAKQLGVDKGALIVKVLPNTPAAKADLHGMRRGPHGEILIGDVILAMNGEQVDNAEDVYTVLGQYHPDDTVKLTILREGQQQDVQVTLEAAQ